MRKQQRVIIEQVKPQLDCGQFFIKRCVDDWVDLTAHIFADGHDLLKAVVLVKHEDQSDVLKKFLYDRLLMMNLKLILSWKSKVFTLIRSKPG